MSHKCSDKEYCHHCKNKSDKASLGVKIVAGFIVAIIAIAVPYVAISAMYESLEEVHPTSEIIDDPLIRDSISEAGESVSTMSSIFSNFIQRP